MASLPPKPPSPSRDHDRPIPPASQPLSDRISPIDRSYPRPPRPPPCDTYIASYENDRRRDLPARRHEPYGRSFPGRLRDVDRERNGYWERDREWDRERDRDRDRDRERDRERERERERGRERERERERRDWERSRDWEREKERNRDRDRTWDRERQYRPADARYYPSTSRRIDDIPYDRRRPYRRSPPPYSASDSSYPRPSPRPRCSRSPARRRPSSRGPPSPPPSPYRPSSPPFKRIRLGNHAIDASPRSPRSPSQSPPRKLHRLPPSDIKNSIEDSIPDVPAATIEPEHSLLPASSLQSTLPSSSLSLQANSRAILEKAASADCSAAPQPVIQTDSKENNSGNSTPIPLIKQETRSSPAITDIKPSSPHLVVKPERIEPDIKVEASSIVATVQDSVSSPTIFGNSLITSQQPRAPNFLLNISTAGTTSDTIRPHRSPPRGPRGHPKAVSSVSAAQAFPTGPRSRRPFAASSVQSANSPIDNIYKSPQDAEIGLVLPPLPVLPKKDAAISLLEQDIARVEAHRSHLANEYAQISKNTRRALHELDISLIDLRAAESRRKVADSQLEKAKTGTLGIYFLPSHSSSNMQVV